MTDFEDIAVATTAEHVLQITLNRAKARDALAHQPAPRARRGPGRGGRR
ncbi:MAG: hypothetical protein U5L11_03080 [Arhodomonas sp.]|nr:hypothetical protein [Arhodomonas sp.]